MPEIKQVQKNKIIDKEKTPAIKQTKTIKGTIRKFERPIIFTQKLKDNIVNIKNRNRDTYEDSTPENYAENRITEDTQKFTKNTIYTFNKIGEKSLKKSPEIIKDTKNKIENKIKKKIQDEKIKKIKKNIKDPIQNIKIKNISNKSNRKIKISGNTIKNAKKKANIKMAKMQRKRTQQIAKAIKKNTKRAIKAVIRAIRAIIKALNSLLTLLTAGIWIFVLVIVIIGIIGLLVTSIFGIFFSSENRGDSEFKSMSTVILELNQEYNEKINQILRDNSHEKYEIIGERTELKDVVAIYSVKVNGGDNQNEVVTLNAERIQLIKDIFWEMNEISYNITGQPVTKDMSYIEFILRDPVTIHINLSGKSVEEMADKYNFNDEQRNQLKELIDDKYSSAWTSVIYGTSVGSTNIVSVAATQIGNSGGRIYWKWYGFSSRVEWCACFVSWCAQRCGYIEKGIIPKFSGVQSEGIPWFKACGLWKERGFCPKPRRFNIF